jgi:phage terminase small subunit
MAQTRDGLTPKQKRFAKEYVRTGNGAKAARKAGYPERSAASVASENLTKPNVAEFVASLSAEADIVKGLTIEQIAAMTLKEAQHADHAGARVRAQELLLKWKGAFVERIEDITKRESDAISLISALAKISPDAASALRRDLGIAAPDVVVDDTNSSQDGTTAPLTH